MWIWDERNEDGTLDPTLHAIDGIGAKKSKTKFSDLVKKAKEDKVDLHLMNGRLLSQIRTKKAFYIQIHRTEANATNAPTQETNQESQTLIDDAKKDLAHVQHPLAIQVVNKFFNLFLPPEGEPPPSREKFRIETDPNAKPP